MCDSSLCLFSPLSTLFVPYFASFCRSSDACAFGNAVTFSVSEITFIWFIHSSSSSPHFLPPYTRMYCLSFPFLPPLLLSISSPVPPLHCPTSPLFSRSVRYCLKSWAAVWWLKRWQIDTFTHDRTPAEDRTRAERGREEQREREAAREKGKKITSWQQGDPYFHEVKWMDRSRWVCFFNAPSSFILPLFQAI